MKLSVKEKVCYGLGDLSANILFAAISFYLLYFFVNVGGLSPGLASAVFLIAKAWDAITDYLMGRITDKTQSKWGKRRVYMLFGALPYGLCFLLLWLVPGGADQQWEKMLYYTFAYMLFNTAWTVVYIPYNSVTANMTDDYDERTSLNGIRIALANVGLIIGAAVFALLADGVESVFYGIFGDSKRAYLLAAGIFAAIAVAIMFFSGYNIKERVSDAPENDKGFFTTLKEFFKLPEFRNIMMCYLLSMVGFDIIMAVFMFFINDSLGFGGGAMAMVFVAIPLVCAIASSALWVKLSEKYNKHGFTGVVGAGPHTLPLKSVDGCDSTVTLYLTILNGDTTYVEETVTTDELPYEYMDLYYDETTEPGTYTDTLTVDGGEGGCESVIIHTLTVEETTWWQGTSRKELMLTPNPVRIHESVRVHLELTAAEREGLTVQVYSNSGALIRQYEPEGEPITVDGLDAAGVYVVRIVDGLGNVYTGKIIVR